MSRQVAFFDFDGTLTRRDTFLPYLARLLGGPHLALRLLQTSPVLLGYLLGRVANDRAKETLLQACITGWSMQTLREAGVEYARTGLPALLRKEGMQRLDWHREQGHTCVLVSASLDLYLDPWVAGQGLDGLICSRLETDEQDRVSGRLEGDNCHGETKVKLIRQWLSGREVDTVYAYGDTRGDLPMLRMADLGYLWRRSGFVPVPAGQKPA